MTQAASQDRVNPARSTAREMQRMCRALLDGRYHKGEIKRMIAEQFGCRPRTAERYIARARKEMLAETGLTIEEHRAISFAFYSKFAADETLEPRLRIKARRQIDRLYGLFS